MHYAMSGNRFLRRVAGVFTLLLLAAFFVTPAFAAATRTDYVATAVTIPGSGTITITPGERKLVTVTLQNTGTATWRNHGANYLSVYTYGPKYRRSVFDPGTWMGPTQVKPIAEKEVAPGKTATVSFELHAPKTPGVYAETFRLAAEEKAWVEGGEFTLNIHVTDVVVEADPVSSQAAPQVNGYKAELTVLSADRVKAIAGRSILLTAAFKNTGTEVWNRYGLVLPEVSIASDTSTFTHPSWKGTKLTEINGVVKPGETALVDFAILAPQTNGNHVAHFVFAANGTAVPEAAVELPVEVTGGAADIVDAPLKDVTQEETFSYIEQPNIRVGVLIVDDETDHQVHITSHESDFLLKDTEGNLLVELRKDQIITAYVENNRYYFDAGRGKEMSTYGLRFEPVTEHAVMSIENFDRRLTRGAAYADNTFRGVLELRANDAKNRAWIINELPLEYYLRGLAETSDSDPIEFNKAQVTAARTYAYFHMLRDGKRSDEFMDVNSTPSDQLYQGYGREARAPKITEAVNQTAGQIVTYAGEVAITPYYARSNGRTKDWSQVWWGNQPHARGVSVPCDVGKTQWGHGVGMPQSGAKCLAQDGKTFEEILKYFFTGIELVKKWQ